jgi:hypothetical protein
VEEESKEGGRRRREGGSKSRRSRENLLVTRQHLRSTSNDGEVQGIRIRDKPVGDQIIHNHVTNRCRGAGRGEARTEIKVWLQSPTPRKVRLNISVCTWCEPQQ